MAWTVPLPQAQGCLGCAKRVVRAHVQRRAWWPSPHHPVPLPLTCALKAWSARHACAALSPGRMHHQVRSTGTPALQFAPHDVPGRPSISDSCAVLTLPPTCGSGRIRKGLGLPHELPCISSAVHTDIGLQHHGAHVGTHVRAISHTWPSCKHLVVQAGTCA